MAHLMSYIFPALMAYAALSDLLTMKIPNWLTGGLAVVFPVIALLVGMDISALINHILAGIVLLAAGVAMFVPGWMGAGDAKLLAGIGLWFGWGTALIDFLLLTAVAGGGLTLVILVIRSIPLPTFALSWDWLQRLHNKKKGIPYGIALAGAGLLVYPTSGIGHALLSLAN
ncbi:A24 family peptidase [Microvirga arabica]|uniref:A24 family peptidase n=1 Tax=Microvirga arabica TaxID=1128671 RepID=UPI00193A4A34|nr:prepilin peptidase [Microvirga arabica]MBM1172009.1 prepilin peptidase [Microvirga arabica]